MTIKSQERRLVMSIKHLWLVIGLSVLLASCSTGRVCFDRPYSYPRDTTADKGVRYLLGRGVKQNDEKAFYYFSKAAAENDPFAQNEVAYLYASGKGTQRDYKKAFQYYQKAANRGLASAQYNLALLFMHGLGTKVDKKMAAEWLSKSSANGFVPAQEALANAASS